MPVCDVNGCKFRAVTDSLLRDHWTDDHGLLAAEPEEKICQALGCEKQLRSDNQCGFCQAHVNQSERAKESNRKFRQTNPGANAEAVIKYQANHPDRVLASARNYRAEHPTYQRKSHLKRKFDITEEQWEAALVATGNTCALCGTDTPRGRGTFHVDHDHETGAFRAPLCMKCNLGLGYFDHSVSLLLQACVYLESHGTVDKHAADGIDVHNLLDEDSI